MTANRIHYFNNNSPTHFVHQGLNSILALFYLLRHVLEAYNVNFKISKTKYTVTKEPTIQQLKNNRIVPSTN